MKELADKVAFVTGAASGIGLGIATALAQAGVKVMLADIEKTALDKAVEGLKRTNAAVDGVVADVSLRGAIEEAAEKTIQRFGKVHILVNNAGVGGEGRFERTTAAGWEWVLGVNLLSVVYGLQIFVPLMKTHGEGGHVVSTASMAGLIAGAGAAQYRRVGAVPGRHSHEHHGVVAQRAGALQGAHHGACLDRKRPGGRANDCGVHAAHRRGHRSALCRGIGA